MKTLREITIGILLIAFIISLLVIREYKLALEDCNQTIVSCKQTFEDPYFGEYPLDTEIIKEVKVKQ